MTWQQRAACRGMDVNLFFPEKGRGNNVAQVAAARAICARCEVRDECTAWARRIGAREGIWGGLTETQLRRGPDAPKGEKAQEFRLTDQQVTGNYSTTGRAEEKRRLRAEARA